MNRNQCKEIIDTILAISKADETFVSFNGSDSSSVNFAANNILTGTRVQDITVQITVRTGGHYASVSVNSFEKKHVEKSIARALEIAKRLPATENIIPFPDATLALEAPLLFRKNEDVPDEWRADSAGTIIELAKENGLLASGKIATSDTVAAVASSNGLFLYQPSTLAHCSVQAMTKDGMSVGFSEERFHDIKKSNPERVARYAIKKCLAWKNPVQIKPERLTTIFEPQAFADALMPFLGQFTQQAITENRSFLRKLDGASRQGQEMFTKDVNLYSDPFHERLPSLPFSSDGLEVKKRYWIRNGVIESIVVSRFEAHDKSIDPVPFPTNAIMEGGSETLDQIIASSPRCLLVSGFAGLNVEDPANCLLTGSTKNGLFLIEDGKISKAVHNLIIRETPVYMLKRLEKTGAQEYVNPTNVLFPMLLPPIRVTDVMYTRQSGLI